MTPAWSRYLARVVNSPTFDLGAKERFEFVDRVTQVESIEECTPEDQAIIKAAMGDTEEEVVEEEEMAVEAAEPEEEEMAVEAAEKQPAMAAFAQPGDERWK